jgi:hypothetical protein
MTEPHTATGATGHPRVDAALAELDRMADLPPADQVAGFAGVHQELQAVLTTIDSAEPSGQQAGQQAGSPRHPVAMHSVANARQGR